MVSKIVKFDSFHINESNDISFTSLLGLKDLKKVPKNAKIMFCTLIVSNSFFLHIFVYEYK